MVQDPAEKLTVDVWKKFFVRWYFAKSLKLFGSQQLEVGVFLFLESQPCIFMFVFFAFAEIWAETCLYTCFLPCWTFTPVFFGGRGVQVGCPNNINRSGSPGMRVPTTRTIVRATPMIAWRLTRILVKGGVQDREGSETKPKRVYSKQRIC